MEKKINHRYTRINTSMQIICAYRCSSVVHLLPADESGTDRGDSGAVGKWRRKLTTDTHGLTQVCRSSVCIGVHLWFIYCPQMRAELIEEIQELLENGEEN